METNLPSIGTAIRLTDAHVRNFSSRLYEIEFKTLKRPNRVYQDDATEKEVRWALRCFASASACLFRDSLRSYFVACDNNLSAASFLVARLLFETAAMAHYVHKSVEPLVSLKRWKRAFEFMFRANIGSFHMKENRDSSEGDGTEVPIPFYIGKAVDSLDDLLGHKVAKSHYSFLSEFSHPDYFAFSHYWSRNDAMGTVSFLPAPRTDRSYNLTNTICGTIGIMGIAYGQLFQLCDMKTAQRRLAHIVGEYMSNEEESLKAAQKNSRSDPQSSRNLHDV